MNFAAGIGRTALVAPGLSFAEACAAAVRSFGSGELAYLVLTSKPEALLRDRFALAVRAHLQGHAPGLVACREFKDRVDFAVADGADGVPRLLVEFKAGHSTNPKYIIDQLAGDVVKCCDLQASSRTETPAFIVLALIHYRSAAPQGLDDVVKYQPETRRAQRKMPQAEILAECKSRLAAVYPELEALALPPELGAEFGVEVELHWYVMGPITPALPGMAARETIASRRASRIKP